MGSTQYRALRVRSRCTGTRGGCKAATPPAWGPRPRHDVLIRPGAPGTMATLALQDDDSAQCAMSGTLALPAGTVKPFPNPWGAHLGRGTGIARTVATPGRRQAVAVQGNRWHSRPAARTQCGVGECLAPGAGRGPRSLCGGCRGLPMWCHHDVGWIQAPPDQGRWMGRAVRRYRDWPEAGGEVLHRRTGCPLRFKDGVPAGLGELVGCGSKS